MTQSEFDRAEKHSTYIICMCMCVCTCDRGPAGEILQYTKNRRFFLEILAKSCKKIVLEIILSSS
jgi:hypothetical protein